MSLDGDSHPRGSPPLIKKKQPEKDIQYMIQVGNGNLLLGKWSGWPWKLDEIGIFMYFSP